MDRTPEEQAYITTEDAVRRIRAALERRSGKAWSVSADRFTPGWIHITSPLSARFPATSPRWYARRSPSSVGSPACTGTSSLGKGRRARH